MAARQSAVSLRHRWKGVMAALDDAVTAMKNMVVALNNQTTALRASLPVVQSVATSATAGSHGAAPAQVAGYLNITLPDGTAAKVPYFNP